MRCPKCGYISFDKVTSCSQCQTDVTELAQSLNGTAFQPMNNFFLGTLLPDYMSNQGGAEPSNLQDAADDLNISMDDLENLGEIGDIPGETGSLDLGVGLSDDENAISLQDVVVGEVDLSDFDDDDFDNVDTMQLSAEQLDGIHAQSEAEEEQVDLTDVPDMNLDDVDLDLDEVSLDSGDDMASLDLQMDEDSDETAVDLAAIDLSLGEDEVTESLDLADLDLGDLEMETDEEKKEGDLPDLEL